MAYATISYVSSNEWYFEEETPALNNKTVRYIVAGCKTITKYEGGIPITLISNGEVYGNAYIQENVEFLRGTNYPPNSDQYYLNYPLHENINYTSKGLYLNLSNISSLHAVPDIPDGYVFVGWCIEFYLSGDLGSYVVGPGSDESQWFGYVGTDNSLVIKNNEWGTDIYAAPICRERDVTIFFDFQDGTSSSQSVNIKGNEKEGDLPENPTRSGFEFKGWFTTSNVSDQNIGSKYHVSDIETYMPDFDTTLYAGWERKSVKVTLDSNGGLLIGDWELDKKVGDVYGNLSTPTKEGYIFKGWYLTNDFSGDAIQPNTEVTSNEDHSLYAKWFGFSVRINKKSQGDASDVDSIGTLQLLTDPNNTIVAESSGGVLDYSGPYNKTYKVKLDLDSDGDDFFWNAIGIKGEKEFKFVPAPESVLEYDYYLKRKNFFGISFLYDDNLGSVNVESPSEPDYEGKYEEGKEITIRLSPKVGCKLKSFKCFNGTTGALIDGKENPTGETYSFIIRSDVSVQINFQKNNYLISVEADPDSKDAIRSVSASSSNVNHGDSVVLRAEVEDGFVFGGWFLQGDLVSEDSQYEVEVTDDAHYIAKAKAVFNFDIQYNDNGLKGYDNNITLTINGTQYSDFPLNVSFILGESFEYQLNCNDWIFNGWAGSDNTMLEYGEHGVVVSRTSMTFLAKVVSVPIPRKITINFFADADAGDVYFTSSMLSGALLVISDDNHIDYFDNRAEITINQPQEVVISFTDIITEPSSGRELYFYSVSGGGVTFDEGEYRLFVSDNLDLDAKYGSGGDKVVRIGYVDGNNRTMGKIQMNATSSEDGNSEISFTGSRLEIVNISAMAFNGYKFVGWFTANDGNDDAMYSDDAIIDLVIRADINLYAKFTEDENAIYEFEGSDRNMMMEWRSKVYVGSRPFNMSAVRVDALSYPIESLSVEMFSSPATKASDSAKVSITNINSDKSRRLPKMRMERYLQIAVKHNEEIDAIFVGTSMGGLTV
jgi:uncharacterized repeat protein (TIGR02543 family)